MIKLFILLLCAAFTASAPANAQTGCVTSSALGRTTAQEAACINGLQNQIHKTMAAQTQKALAYEKNSATNLATVKACSSNLSPESEYAELSKTLICLSENAFAGEKAVASFLSEYKSLIARLTSQTPALDQEIEALVAKKQNRLYWLVEGARRKVLYVGQEYSLGETMGKFFDIASTHLKVTTTFHIFGSNDTIPFEQLRSFSYVASNSNPDGTIGKFKVTTIDGRTYQDNSYQETWPIKNYPEGSGWAAITSISGTAFSYIDGSAYKTNNAQFSLKQPELNGYEVTLVNKDEAQKWISFIETKISEAVKVENAARAQKEAARDMLVTNLKGAAKGDEDSCQGTVSNTRPLSDETILSCQFLAGSVALGVIKQNGWLVTNISSVQDGRGTTVVSIRKAK